MAIRKPKVTLRPGAATFAMRGERIIEVSSDAGGCLVSIMERDGRLRIEIYRVDGAVDTIAPSNAATTQEEK